MFGIGAQELAIILVVALLVFGPKRLPDLARTLGRGLAEFRRASSDLRQSINLEVEPDADEQRRIHRPPEEGPATAPPSSPEQAPETAASAPDVQNDTAHSTPDSAAEASERPASSAGREEDPTSG